MIQRDWATKTLAGLILGLVLALQCSVVLAHILAHEVQAPPPIQAQLTMWVVMPIWLGVLSGCYLFRSGGRAWAWLTATNLVALGAVTLLHSA